MEEIFESYSNYGEDAMLHGVMKRFSHTSNQNFLEQSTYIDIGCFDPVHGNNTFFLYKMGWSGTAIDANPLFQSRYVEKRPRDNFCNYLVSSKNVFQNFYIFDDNLQCSTADKNFAEKISKSYNISVSRTIVVKSKTINDIVKEHIDKFGSGPRVLNVDVEGKDYEIISSYSFFYRPLFIFVEEEILDVYSNSNTRNFMKSKNYLPVSNNFLTTIYMDNDSGLVEELKKLGPLT